jgi:hypothetical protein
MSNTFKNFIGGQWVAPSTDNYFENRNPADQNDLIGRFPQSGVEDVHAAIDSARRGFEGWKRTPAPARGDVLRRVGDLMAARKEEIANLMTREMGKPLAETRGDVQEGIDTAYYAATEGRRLFGHTVPSELANKWAMSMRRPIGVCGLITPFNFPMAIPTWKTFPALLCGNSVVLKPAEDVPHTATALVEILLAAGLPLPRLIWAHGYVQWGGTKVSKSEGSSVSLDDAIDHYGPDALRYFLLREVGFENDGDFTFDRFDARYTSELADGLGNLASRTTAMLAKFRAGVVPDAVTRESLDEAGDRAVAEYATAMDAIDLKGAADAAWRLVSEANGYIVISAPWVLAKQGDEARLDATLAALARCLVRLAVMTSPFMPTKAQELWAALGQTSTLEAAWNAAVAPAIAGATVTKPENLFPKPPA